MTTPAHKILVVEDDRDIRETMVGALQDEGYVVDSAIDGLDALERLRASDRLPGLILLDLMMPRMNGLEFWGEVARDEAWRRIPIVVVSADAHGRKHAATMNAAAYLKKPTGLLALLETVAKVLGTS